MHVNIVEFSLTIFACQKSINHHLHETFKPATLGQNPPQRAFLDAAYTPGNKFLDKLRLILLRAIFPGATHVSINTCPRCFLGARTMRPYV